MCTTPSALAAGDVMKYTPRSKTIRHPIPDREARMTEAKQVAALPVRKAGDGSLEVLLVTSRETGRWVIPKGWPSKRLKDKDAAAREARQEAGVTGKIRGKPLGGYRYRKIEPGGSRLLDVTVYLLKVERERKRWPEQNERERSWMALEVAARRVREPNLRQLILGLQNAHGQKLKAG